MEGFPIEQTENNINQEKFDELKAVIDSLSKTITDSDSAYEVASRINDFKNDFESEGLKLSDYSLGALLLSSKEFDLQDYNNFDTEDNKIENFIRNLNNKETQENKAA
jgi:predicted PolB exonuclease-like 3'-5' exonuclease